MPSNMISLVSADEILLTTKEASSVVRLSPKTLANWRALGIGPAYTKLSEGNGGRVRYRLADLQRFLAKRHIEVA